jgi:hypothetical protein
MRVIKLPQQVHLMIERSLSINLNPPHPTTLCLKENHVMHLYLTSHHVSRRNPCIHHQGKGLQGGGLRGSLRVTSHALGSVRECEGINLHTLKVTHSQLLEGFKCESQTENIKRLKNQGTLPSL